MSETGTATRRGDASLEELVRACLPDGTTLRNLQREGDVFVASFAGGTGTAHAVEWWDAAIPRPAYRRGARLAFAYRVPTAADAGDLEARAIAALLTAEAQLVSLSTARVGQRVDAPGRLAFLRENDLSLRIARDLPAAGSLRRAAAQLIERELAVDGPVSEVHLYFENRCGQSCEFCEEPLIRERPLQRVAHRLQMLRQQVGLDLVATGAFDAVVGALWSRSEPLPLTITGHDWLLHPGRNALLETLESSRRSRLRLQGPCVELDSPDLARRVARLPGLEWVATTLQSADADEHDAMVGSRGAHARLVRALDQLEALGVAVKLTLVLTRRAVHGLPATLRWLRERGRTVLASAFIPDAALGDVGDRLPFFDDLRAALDQSVADAAVAVEAFVGVPECVVPVSLRRRVVPAIRTAQRAAPVFAEICSRCSARSSCPGLPPGYLRAFGARGVVPI